MDWDIIREVFNAALDLPHSERESYVRTASCGSEEMYSAIDSLLKTEESLGGFLEKPFGYQPPPQAAIRPGDLLCQRFRIQRLIGEGGMGHVYEAWDIELGRPVALKAIRPEIAQQPEALKRFRREVSVALAITHPNVCRTFDIKRDTILLDPAQGDMPGNSAEIIFLTMELLPGETLAARITRDGAIPLDQALPLATQIGEALTCAHSLGIYHRDIKPANVMLVPADNSTNTPIQPRAVLTDFGLARQQALFRTDDFSAFSHSGAPIGTLSYMAPEQLEGKPTSAATDVYAFGLVLHEMVTGKRVFPSSNPLSHLAERLNAPSPRRLQPNLPEAWHQAIEGCLRLDPATRFQSATEVLTVLHGGHVPLPSLAYSKFPIQRPTPNKFSLQNWSKTRKFTAAIISLAVMSLFAYALRLYITKADAAVTPGALVYMTQVKNDTGEKSFDNLSELMQAGLTQSAHINLLDQGRVGDLLQQMTKAPDTVITEPIAREIAMRAGAVRVIFPKVSGHNGSYKLDIDIQQPDNTPNRYRDHWPKSFTWQTTGNTNPGTIPAELLTTIRNTSDWIRKQVGESANDIARLDTPPEDVTTSNWEALAAYSGAQKFLRIGQKENAIALLKDAVRIDPGFAKAYADLGDNLVSIDMRDEGYKAYLDALNENSSHRLTRKERDFIKGTFAYDTRDYQASYSAFRDYSAFFGNDFNGWFYQSLPLDMLDRPNDALQVLKRADALSSGNRHGAAGGIVYNYMILGDHKSARDWIEIVKNNGRLDLATYLTGVEAFLEGNYDLAEKSFQKLQTSDSHDFQSLAYSVSGRLLAERGRYSDAKKTLINGIQSTQSTASANNLGLQWIDLAYVDLKLGNSSACLDEVSRGVQLNSSPDALLWASTTLGNALPSLTKTQRHSVHDLLLGMMRKLSAEDLGQVYTLARARIRGEIALSENHPREALIAFRQADLIDAPLCAREYLVRALTLVASIENNPAKALELRNEALNASAKSAFNPARIWRRAWDNPPGFVADEMTSYLSIARQLSINSADKSNVENSLKSLRPLSFSKKDLEVRP